MTEGFRRLVCFTVAFAAQVCTADNPALPDADFDLGPVFTFVEENDMVVKTDRHYTQGIKFSYLHGDNAIPACIESLSQWLPAIGYSKRADRIGGQIGQNIYTPADIKATELLRCDRPYAGWLYAGLNLQRRGLTAGLWPTLESLEFQFGVIGPESLAEEAQTWVHEVRDIDLPQGWNNQLKTEPGVALRYWRGLRLSPSASAARYFDVVPHVAGSLGNVETALRLGGRLRLGINLPDNFGVQTINSLLSTDGGWSTNGNHQWGIHGFTSFETWFVGYTAFLDGNLFRHSHSVDKEPVVLEWQSGVEVTSRRLGLALSYVFRSREFPQQEFSNGYGSLSMKINF